MQGIVRVTVCQLSDDPSHFEQDWSALVRHVQSEEADLVLLPEMPFTEWFAYTREYDEKTWREAVCRHEEPAEKRVRDLDPAIVVGTRPVDRGRLRHNMGFVACSPSGITDIHVKRYLPDEDGVWEASWYQAGDRSAEFETFRVEPATAGFLICSEIWFPEHGRAMGKRGAHLLLTPRRTGTATVEKWLVAGRAAATASGCFSLSSNSVNSRNTDFGGGSWVIGPDGEVLAVTSMDRPFATVEIDPGDAERAKSTYPRYMS